MVTIFRKWVEAYRSLLNYRRCRRAIREADRRHITTGKKYLVLMYGGRPMVIGKQALKAKIKSGFFNKGFTAEKAEALAIYKTR